MEAQSDHHGRHAADPECSARRHRGKSRGIFASSSDVLAPRVARLCGGWGISSSTLAVLREPSDGARSFPPHGLDGGRSSVGDLAPNTHAPYGRCRPASTDYACSCGGVRPSQPGLPDGFRFTGVDTGASAWLARMAGAVPCSRPLSWSGSEISQTPSALIRSRQLLRTCSSSCTPSLPELRILFLKRDNAPGACAARLPPLASPISRGSLSVSPFHAGGAWRGSPITRNSRYRFTANSACRVNTPAT